MLMKITNLVRFLIFDYQNILIFDNSAPPINILFMSKTDPKNSKPEFKIQFSDSIANNDSEYGKQVRQMFNDLNGGLGQILPPGYMGVAVNRGSSQKSTLTQEQKDKIKKAEDIAIKDQQIDSLRKKELQILFNEQELKEFYQFMNHQTVGYDKEINTAYYYITDVIAFIKGLDPLD